MPLETATPENDPDSSAETAGLPVELTCLACGAPDPKPWATATDLEYFTTAQRFRYVRCDACHALSIDPVPRGRLAEIYPSNYYAYAGTGGAGVAVRIKEWLDRRSFGGVLRQIGGDRLAALDVGGGAGWLLTTLQGLDPRVTETHVVDLDPRAGDKARALGHRYHEGRIEDFTPPRTFDLIMLLNLIEHVDDPRGVLCKLRDCLAPGGLVLVKTPNVDALDARLFRHQNWGGYHCPRHWVLFDMPGFERLARACGLKVVSASYTQGAPFWATSVLFWLQARGLAKLSATRPAVYHPLFGLLSAAFAAFDMLRAPLGAKTSQMFFLLGRDAS
jgi:2-polyprenyl-3-methyl-5-hydroxy-6-metoxy-1,4-benzoquinol methylase